MTQARKEDEITAGNAERKERFFEEHTKANFFALRAPVSSMNDSGFCGVSAA
jgi:hypothetical protein